MRKIIGIFLLSVLAAIAADIPRPGKDFTFRLPSGEQVALSKYKGKVIVLEFLITGCSHCQRCSQTMQKLSKEFAARGVQMLGVAIAEDDEKKIPGYLKEFGISYPIGYHLSRSHVLEFLQHPVMAQLMMPQLAIVDRGFVVQSQHGGSDETFFGPPTDKTGIEEKNLRAEILKVLGPPPAAKQAPAKK